MWARSRYDNAKARRDVESTAKKVFVIVCYVLLFVQQIGCVLLGDQNPSVFFAMSVWQQIWSGLGGMLAGVLGAHASRAIYLAENKARSYRRIFLRDMAIGVMAFGIGASQLYLAYGKFKKRPPYPGLLVLKLSDIEYTPFLLVIFILAALWWSIHRVDMTLVPVTTRVAVNAAVVALTAGLVAILAAFADGSPSWSWGLVTAVAVALVIIFVVAIIEASGHSREDETLAALAKVCAGRGRAVACCFTAVFFFCVESWLPGDTCFLSCRIWGEEPAPCPPPAFHCARNLAFLLTHWLFRRLPPARPPARPPAYPFYSVQLGTGSGRWAKCT